MSDVFDVKTLPLHSQRYFSMIQFILRHRIEKRLGNLNPDPIVPIDFRTSQAIPRHIEAYSEEYDTYMLLHPDDRIIPVSFKDKK